MIDDFIINRKPWVEGKFIGPSIHDLLLAYYVTQGETLERAKQFVEMHIKQLKEESRA